MSDVDTTSVETDVSDNSSLDTVLTSDNSVNENTDTNSDAGTSADDDASIDDNVNTDEDTDEDTGEEGSQSPNDTYADFSLPDGVEVDAIALEEVKPIFKELGLNQEQSQKLIDHYVKQVQASSQKQVDTFNQLTSEWREKSQNDKEFGGDKFEENVKVAHNAISKYGTPELKQLLNDHGVGNHPEVIRFMVRVGHTLKEDVPGSSGGAVSKSEDHATLLYGK